MKMTHDTDVLKPENADLLVILGELQTFLGEAAHQGIPLHEVEHAVWQQVLRMGRRNTASDTATAHSPFA